MVAYSRIGGHLENVPRPHERKWPDSEEKRRVKVDVYTWRGMSLGAVHWYGSVEEESNPVWDSSILDWRLCWDDEKATGREFRGDFDTKEEVVSWAKEIIGREFEPETHYLHFEYDTRAELFEGCGFDIELMGHNFDEKSDLVAFKLRIKYGSQNEGD
jgi:hypothetical protein